LPYGISLRDSTIVISKKFLLFIITYLLTDPYVKVWLMFGEKRVEKKKTPIYKCNLNPIFNASFEFDVPWEQIRDCALDVQVMDFDTVGRNELIGKLLLACKILLKQD
jgi:Ca2+-dependent lipid-binding protein